MNGTALDIHGTSNAWIRKNGQKYGWVPNDYSGSHGGHFIFGGGGPGNVQSSISASSIQSMPSQSTGTPGQMPKAQPNVVLDLILRHNNQLLHHLVLVEDQRNLIFLPPILIISIPCIHKYSIMW